MEKWINTTQIPSSSAILKFESSAGYSAATAKRRARNDQAGIAGGSAHMIGFIELVS
jgi:hypothetical protein